MPLYIFTRMTICPYTPKQILIFLLEQGSESLHFFLYQKLTFLELLPLTQYFCTKLLKTILLVVIYTPLGTKTLQLESVVKSC